MYDPYDFVTSALISLIIIIMSQKIITKEKLLLVFEKVWITVFRIINTFAVYQFHV